MREIKHKTKRTFLSWENKGIHGDIVRAIALCDSDGYFDYAINCCRDGQMGEKDGNGVYARIWYGDYICNGEVANLRPATTSEVSLYLQYCSCERYGDNGQYDYTIVHGYYQTDVYSEYRPTLWQRIKNLFGK